MKIIQSRNAVTAVFAAAVWMIILYGCTNFQSLFLSYGREKGKTIAFRTEAFSAKVKGSYQPTDKEVIWVYLSFHDIELYGEKLVVDTSNISIKCDPAFSCKWIGIETYSGSNKGRVVFEYPAPNYPQYFHLKFLMKCDTTQFQQAKNDSVKCLVTVPTASDPIVLNFAGSDFLGTLPPHCVARDAFRREGFKPAIDVDRGMSAWNSRGFENNNLTKITFDGKEEQPNDSMVDHR